MRAAGGPPRPARAPDAGWPNAFPWAEAMGAGLGRLRLSSDAFWRLTPRELAAALGALAPAIGGPPMSRADLAALMARYPDTP